MPASVPPRRRPNPAPQPGRRPKVAGLRRPETRTDQEPDGIVEADTQVIPKITATDPPVAGDSVETPKPRAKRRERPSPKPKAEQEPDVAAQPEPAAGEAVVPPERPRSLLVPSVLGVVAVLIGGLAVWFGIEWTHAGGGDTSNTALTDNATTAEVSGQVTSAVNTLFSIDYTNLAKSQDAVPKLLTGSAQCQYNEQFKLVRQLAPSEKLVLTTTVLDRGVEMLQGDTARVLLLVDQHDMRATTNQSADAMSMFTVNAVKQGGAWKISAINTFNGNNTSACK